MPNKDPEKRREYNKNYYAANIDRLRRRDRERHENDPSLRAAGTERARRWRENNPERSKDNSTRSQLRKFGLTPEQFDEMLEAQQGSCALCSDTEGRAGARLHVDHNHDTAWVRGLLCVRCNTALSRLEADISWAERAVEYLAHHQAAEWDSV